MRKIPELDGVRALAILPVLAVHGGEGRLFNGGYLGVDLFFVLSGFLITSLLLEEHAASSRVDLAAFYRRRALRILPPLALAVPLALAIGNPPDPMAEVAAVTLFYANLVDWRTLDLMSHAWSLAIEEHFYLVWPALFLVLARGGPHRIVHAAAWLMLVGLLMRIALVAAGADHETVYRFTLCRIDSLAAGCGAAAWMKTADPRPVPAVLPALLLVGFVAMCAFGPGHAAAPRAMLLFGFTGFALALAAFIVLVLRSDAVGVRRLLATPVMRYVGLRSYGLYLYHLPLFALFDPLRVPGVGNFLAVSALRLGATFLVAEISYRTLEAWARRRRHDFTIRSSIQTPV